MRAQLRRQIASVHGTEDRISADQGRATDRPTEPSGSAQLAYLGTDQTTFSLRAIGYARWPLSPIFRSISTIAPQLDLIAAWFAL